MTQQQLEVFTKIQLGLITLFSSPNDPLVTLNDGMTVSLFGYISDLWKDPLLLDPILEYYEKDMQYLGYGLDKTNWKLTF